MNVICPICDQNQSQDPTKSWSYGKIIEKRTAKKTTWGASVNCSQYYCKCGCAFKFYLTTKGKFWTNPKSKKIS